MTFTAKSAFHRAAIALCISLISLPAFSASCNNGKAEPCWTTKYANGATWYKCLACDSSGQARQIGEWTQAGNWGEADYRRNCGC